MENRGQPVPGRQRNDLNSSGEEQRVREHRHCIGTFPRHRCEGALELVPSANRNGLQADAQLSCGALGRLPPGLAPGGSGFHNSATREILGAASFRSSSLLPCTSGVGSLVNPVMFPPGRARLAMKPEPTGSLDVVITTGVFAVACWTAATTGFPPVTMTSRSRRASSAASSGSRSCLSPGKAPLEDDIAPLHIAELAQPLFERPGQWLLLIGRRGLDVADADRLATHLRVGGEWCCESALEASRNVRR